MSEMIYLDYMSTTPVDDRVIADMNEVLGAKQDFANPASSHQMGQTAYARVEQARSQVAEAIGADSADIIWTAGATESNNIALQGAAQFYKRQGKHLITTAIEHPAVGSVMKKLESEGFEVTYLKPCSSGMVDPAELLAACREDTILVSVMWVNNETGVIQPIEAIGASLKKRGIVFHVDAAQALGKCPIDLKQIPVDLLSLSAHKCYGPKGVGALFVRRGVKLSPVLFGSSHENGLRPGTLATHQVIGLGSACRLIDDHHAIAQKKKRLWSGLSAIPGVCQHVPESPVVPHCLSLYVEGISVRALLACMPHLAISLGAACNASTMKPSAVLLAMGVPPVIAENSCRLSVGRYLDDDAIDQVIKDFKEAVAYLRGLSPDLPDSVIKHKHGYAFGGECERFTHEGCFKSPSDGVSLRVTARVKEGVIQEAMFLCQGSPQWLSVCALFCAKLAGQSFNQLSSWSRGDWCDSLALSDNASHLLQGLLTTLKAMKHEKESQ